MRRLPSVVPLLALAGLAHGRQMAGPRLLNPSFEMDGTTILGVGYVAQGNAITGWKVSFPIGVARNTQTGPFVDNGVVPDGRNVCVLQNLASISQTIGGLVARKVYRLRLRANGRASDAPDHGGLAVELNGTVLISMAHVQPVGKGNPYHLLDAFFTAGTGSAELVIRQTNPTSGVSVLLDDIHIEEATPPNGRDVIQVNPATPLTSATVALEQDLTDVAWIWTNETPRPASLARSGIRFFHRTFSLPTRPKRVTIVFTADNECCVLMNGALAGWASAFNRLFVADVTHLAREGRNTITVQASNAGTEMNPAGLIAKLVASCAGHRAPVVVTTDESWRWSLSRDAPVQTWKPVRRAGEMGCAPWGWVGPASLRVSQWFPEFRVEPNDPVAQSMRRLFSLHYEGGRPACTLWDGWLPLAGLWPVRGRDVTDESSVAAWKQALLSREIIGDGYVATHQHRGYGHSKGWPIPLYMQTGGVGFHFSLADDPFRSWVARTTDPGKWSLEGLRPIRLDPDRGWELEILAPHGSMTTPTFSIPMAAAPCVRVEWQVSHGQVGQASVQWATEDRPEMDHARQVGFAPVTARDGMAYSDVLLYPNPAWTDAGRMCRLRLNVDGTPGSRIVLKSMITPADTRHNVNNPCFVQGSAIYLGWTGDLDFLRKNIGRMRKAMAYSIPEFRLRESRCVDMPWYGHDGRSGYVRKPDGTRMSRYAGGVGNNYWDLLPFGGKDTLATVYHYDALRRMAHLERLIRRHKEWRIPDDPNLIPPDELEDLAARMKEYAGKLLWNEATGRFVACIDRDGVAHDYGYTSVNLEAIHYGFATQEQARAIFDWLDGRRRVAGDTSQGADIYRWVFGPRCSTKRNTEWYSGMWEPLNVPFGDQVQDGGGVLGFSYFDLMARLRTLGPDNAYRRLRRIAGWFDEVQAEGGYRAYYARPGRGTLQGGGPPGGLGLDYEFVESVLVPQVMVYGFAGFEPDLEGFRLEPRLPSCWRSLTISRLRYHGVVLDVMVSPRTLQVTVRAGRPVGPLRWLPPSSGTWSATVASAGRSLTRMVVSHAGVIVPTRPGSVVRLQRR